MDGRTDGWMDGWMDDRWMDGWKDKYDFKILSPDLFYINKTNCIFPGTYFSLAIKNDLAMDSICKLGYFTIVHGDKLCPVHLPGKNIFCPGQNVFCPGQNVFCPE